MLDIIIIATLALFMYIGYRRGLVGAIFRLLSFVLSIILAIYLYPIVADWMRTTPVYTGLRDYIIRTMGLEDVVLTHATDLIATLPVPELLRRALLQQSPEIYGTLGIYTIEQHIASFFAGMAINIISMILVFILVRMILGIVANMLDIVGRLPIVRYFNRGGGLVLGLVQGVIVIWIGLAVINLFFLDPTRPELVRLLNESLLAGWIYEHNPIMAMLANI